MSSAFAELAVLLLLGGSPGPSPTTAAEVARLLRTFRGTTTLRAHFREEKRLAVLAVPLTSEGEIEFSAPDRLARQVTAPSPSRMVIEGSHLSFSEGQGVHSIPLDQSPVARMFVDSFLEILAGDQAGLERLYDMALARHGERWELKLTPRAAPLLDWLAAIDVSGHGAIVDRLLVREKSGDETATAFSAVELGRPFSADETRRLFGFPSR
ncbi:MAG: LolA family protein [Myxococcales bacterium]